MRTTLLYLLGILTAASAISTDLYLPAMPAITEALQTTPAQIQLTLSIFFLGYGLGQLFYGPLCDSFGRRVILLYGLSLYIIASVFCALSTNIEQLLVARLFQALGGCAAAVIPRAIIADHTTGSATSKALSTAMTVTIIGPLIAPSVGGLILLLAPWQVIFWVLTGYGVLCAAATWRYIEESLPVAKRQVFHWRNITAGYQQVFSNRSILLLLASEVCASIALFTFITSSSFVFINYYHLSPQQFGLLFTVVALGLLIGSILNSKLVMRLGSITTLQYGLGVSLTGAVLLIGSITLLPDNLPFFVCALWICIAPSILVRANYVALGFTYLPGRTGTVSAVFGATSMGIGGVVAGVISMQNVGSQIPMAWTMIVTYAMSAGCYLCWKKYGRVGGE